MIISPQIQKAGTLDNVVELINDTSNLIDLKSNASPERLAAECAYQAAYENSKEYGLELSIEDLAFHLDFVLDAGANFDYQDALEILINELNNDA